MAGPAMLGPGAQSHTREAPLGPPALQFVRPSTVQAAYTISGISRDNTGAVLGNCTVDLFYATGDKQRAASTTSDANGAYTFVSGDNVGTYFVVAYKDGATPVGGTSLQTLQFT